MKTHNEARLLCSVSTRDLEDVNIVEVINVTWQGERNWPLRLRLSELHYFNDTLHVQRIGDRIVGFPWPLRVIGDGLPWDNSLLCIRTDRNRLQVALHASGYLLTRLLQRFERRMVMTAQIWGLAHRPLNEYPAWRHLKKPNFTFITRRIGCIARRTGKANPV